METRSCNEVGMVGDYRMISILAISDITNGHERLVKESLEREYAVVDGSDDLIRRVKLELGLKKASWPLVCIPFTLMVTIIVFIYSASVESQWISSPGSYVAADLLR